jgi:outer membrane lipoprotein-sorting protein
MPKSRAEMNKNIIQLVMIFLTAAGACWAGCCSASHGPKPKEEVKADPVDKILEQLRQKTAELKSYECLVEYEVNQPTFESRTLRKGTLHYKKAGKDSAMRINFKTFQQDDEEAEKYIDDYIINGHWLTKVDYKFEGVWLTHTDHQLKNVQCRQLAEPNERIDANNPIDPLDLVTREFPIVGFTKVEQLKKEFEIELIEQKGPEAKKTIQLHLKVRPDSVYKDEYATIDFWVDKKLGLPVRIVAVAIAEDVGLEPDIEELRFIKPKINKKISKKVFGIKIPKGFGKPEIFPLKKTEGTKESQPGTDSQG